MRVNVYFQKKRIFAAPTSWFGRHYTFKRKRLNLFSLINLANFSEERTSECSCVCMHLSCHIRRGIVACFTLQGFARAHQWK